MNAPDKIRCTKCERVLDKDKVVWLALRNSTHTYHDPNVVEGADWIDTWDDQGGFPFGPDCARTMLMETIDATDFRPLY